MLLAPREPPARERLPRSGYDFFSLNFDRTYR
jgi:hypothetical protein